MLQCQLHKFLAERGQSLHDFSLEVGIHYNKLHKLYYQRAIRVDLELISTLCRHLQCGVGDLFIVLPKGTKPKLPPEARLKRGRSGGLTGQAK